MGLGPRCGGWRIKGLEERRRNLDSSRDPVQKGADPGFMRGCMWGWTLGLERIGDQERADGGGARDAAGDGLARAKGRG